MKDTGQMSMAARDLSAKRASMVDSKDPKASTMLRFTTPKATVPKAMVSKSTSPKTTLPKAVASKAIIPKASTPKASSPKAIAPKATSPKAPASPTKPAREPSDQLFNELSKIIAKQRQSEALFVSGLSESAKPTRSPHGPSNFPKHHKLIGDLTNDSGQRSFGSKLSLSVGKSPFGSKLSFESKTSLVSKQSLEFNPSSFESKRTLFEPKPSPKLQFVSGRPPVTPVWQQPARESKPRLPDSKVLSVDKRERKTDIMGIKQKRKPSPTPRRAKTDEKIRKKPAKRHFTRIVKKIKEPKYIDQSDQKEQRKSCRICFSTQCNKKTGDLIVPCNCRGIFATVHQRCISDWIVAMCSDTCDICRFKFFIRARHKGLLDFLIEEHQFHFVWQTLAIVFFALYLILIAAAFVQVVEHYSFLTDNYTLVYKISCSVLIFLLLCYTGYYFAERALTYREWRKYKYHITVKPNPNYRISELITPPPDIIRSSGLGQYSIKPLMRPVL